MSEIRHEWTGSVLTITSASGTSSADLKGPKGDTGPRGPQGPAGIILDEEGNVKVDLSKYYTADEVDAKLENVDLEGYATEEYVRLQITNNQPDLTDYATKNYVSTQIAQAQLGGSGDGSGVDLSGYATKDDLNDYATKAELDDIKNNGTAANVDIDNKTIIRANGKLKTAIGGAEYMTGDLIFESYASTWVLDSGNTGGMSSGDYIIGSSTYNFENNKSYFVVITWADGDQSKVYYTNDDASYGDCLSYEFHTGDPGFSNTTVSRFWVYTNKTTDNVYFYKQNNTKDDFTHIAIYDGEITQVVEQIDSKFIPVDGETIIVNEDGKLAVVGGGSGEDTPVDLSNYYTKAEVDANYYTKAQVDAIALNGTVDLSSYYTKSEIDALLAQIETYPSAEEVEY